ncbi:MAG: chemotaxis-specific protein-glutamate methyltransferase CheB [Hormoscilla sp.]
MNKVVRVLIVDDSAYVRKVIKQMLSRSPFIEVVGTARDGEEALEMIDIYNPDVVTLDLIMPQMDGVKFLIQQMEKRPVPVVVVSIANEGGETGQAALYAGAVDFVQKPTALATDKIYEIRDELISKIKAAASVPLNRFASVPASERQIPPESLTIRRSEKVDIVVIGISTGGPQALSFLIPQLPANLGVPVAIVLHMPKGYTEMYAKRLDQMSEVKVIEASEGAVVGPNMAIVARAGRHLTFKRIDENTVETHLDAKPSQTLHRPSADVMFESAAKVYGDRVLGIVMTGMGSDGKQGASWIKAKGGKIFTESRTSCVVYGMPREVDEAGLSDRSVHLEEMAQAIIEAL